MDGKFIPIEKGTEYEASYLPNEGEDGVSRVQATRTGSAGTQIKTSFFKGAWQTHDGVGTLKTPYSNMSYTYGPVTVPTNGHIWADEQVVVEDPTANLSEFTMFPKELPLPDGAKSEGPTQDFKVRRSQGFRVFDGTKVYVDDDTNGVGAQIPTEADNTSIARSRAGGHKRERNPVFDKWGGGGSSTDNSPVNSDSEGGW